jgi:fatty-acid peroxygenase
VHRLADEADAMPRLPGFDSTLALLREGYGFVSRRCEQLRSDAFATRLMGRDVVCARGEAAAVMFYQPDRFTRRGAVPPTVTRLLQGKNSVQQLDDAAHHRRKALFLSLLNPAATTRLVQCFEQEWRTHASRWPGCEKVVLHYELESILCAAACRWAGVPLEDDQVDRRARELAAMIEGAGAFGLRLVRGWQLRRSNERWISGVIAMLRTSPGGNSPAAVIATHQDAYGGLLPNEVAVTELINLLRPTVAVARWVTFAALALHEQPHLRSRFGEPDFPLHFVQEVRRYFPFFPMIGGYAREPFRWHGHLFRTGDWVMLDLYGTNHDPAVWSTPERFDPDRFRGWNGSPFNFIAQGAGGYERGHRCPGENPSIALLMAAVRELVAMDYEVPPQDLRYRINRFPSIPESRFVMRAVRLRT